MWYSLGRVLQLMGLLVLPVGVAGNVARPDAVDLKQSLGIAALGIALFSLGWFIQSKAPPPG
jgi:hypothetical protein